MPQCETLDSEFGEASGNGPAARATLAKRAVFVKDAWFGIRVGATRFRSVPEFRMEYNGRATNEHRSPYDTYGVAGKASPSRSNNLQTRH